MTPNYPEPEHTVVQHMRNTPRVGEIYRHYKGDNYLILAVAKNANDGSIIVVYCGSFGIDAPTYWHTLEEFLKLVDDSSEFRFEYMPAYQQRETAE